MPAPVDHVERCRGTHPADVALVWINSRSASIVRCRDGTVSIDRIRSDVPPHRRATGHQEHVPTGGDEGARHREAHLDRFVSEVMRSLPPVADLLVVGPGDIRWRLDRAIRAHDAHHGVRRVIRCEPAPRWTRGRLIAEFRQAAGASLPRRPVVAHRWTRRPADQSHISWPVAEKR